MAEFQSNPTFAKFVQSRIWHSCNDPNFQMPQPQGNKYRSRNCFYLPPAFENKTEEYIRYVSKQLNTSPDKPLELEAQMFTLIKAITTYEQGASFANHYFDSTIENCISLV
ncbi:hypothetical protein [Teredinibacter sp. KSP-S5-2]|uniref:hypothetical protein n=1 Tax=Teredinibacter sp. KSP-S5-2 TaxID=3034506 RepID=UPI0029345C7E|nr:hypothetical protein [Teredinibacter sp. KSP-S5-2]WNO08879.1 hypothetical protein P5V12_18065 [Teredinibacter sp. KSP-S5-2]